MADENDSSDKTEDPTQKRLMTPMTAAMSPKARKSNTLVRDCRRDAGIVEFLLRIAGGEIVMPLRNLIAQFVDDPCRRTGPAAADAEPRICADRGPPACRS